MFGSRVCRLLLVALGIFALAQALWMDADRVPNAAERGIVMRQAGGGSDTDDPEPTETTDPTSSTTSTEGPTQEPSDEPTSTEEEPTSSSTPKTTPTPTSTTDPEDPPEPTSSSKEPDQEESSEPTTEVTTEIVYTTNSDGVVSSFTSETVTTHTPDLSSDESGASSGMSTGTRNTVIGVVVGVGGAIVLGALAFVAWRIWGRKKRSEERDSLMNINPGYSAVDKSEAGTSPGGNTGGRNPFQSTLETYHAPVQVNASSNF